MFNGVPTDERLFLVVAVIAALSLLAVLALLAIFAVVAAVVAVRRIDRDAQARTLAEQTPTSAEAGSR